MDPKVIEMNNLRVLNDYLNQTLDVLARGQRPGTGLGFGSFPGSMPASAAPIGTDVVYGPSPYGFGGSPLFGGISHTHAPFAATNPFTGLPMIGAGYGASYGSFGNWQQPWGQTSIPWTAGQSPWTAGQTAWPGADVARQTQFTQALAAKQTVLEAMCRVAGIPV